MSNSGSGKHKPGKSKAGTMEVVNSDDEDEELDDDDEDEEEIGRAAKEMQSYIGVLARTKVPINVKDWRLVALSVKDNIWGFVEAKNGGRFKSKLTTWYIISYMDSLELFEFPPDDYRMIDVNQWKEFVKDRISPQFQEFRQKQKERRKENKYPHRLGRKPYAQLQEERDKLEKEELEGKRKFEGPVDVLTTALGTPAYSSKVRGVGGFVKPKAYFHLPKRAKLYSDDSARQSIKMVEEENNNILTVERA
ncbi:hypothetical protein ACLB2K_004116 [Fragaria x ananassa]